MGSPNGFSAQLDLDELQNIVDNGSGARSVATRQAAAQYNLGINGTNAAMTAGTTKASSVLVVGSGRQLDFLRVDDLESGVSGTAGKLTVFPSTASKGKLTVTTSDQTGDTIANINMAAQAAARTYTVPDAGASASFVLSTGTSTGIAVTSTEFGALASATNANTGTGKAVILGTSGAVTFAGNITHGALNKIFDTTTGTKFGTATTQKMGFWNATPVIQQASAAQAAVTPSTSYTGADTVDKATVLAAVQAVETLVNRLRLDLVTTGIIKGAA